MLARKKKGKRTPSLGGEEESLPAISASTPSVSRRNFLKSSIISGAAATVITSRKEARAKDLSASFPPSPVTTPFKDPLRVLQPIQWQSCDPNDETYRTIDPYPARQARIGNRECGRGDHQAFPDNPVDQGKMNYYEMRVKEATHKFHSQIPPSKIWGFNGEYPGPLFHSYYGVPNLIRIYNDLPLNTVGFGAPQITTHLHNMHTPSESDGYPGDWFSRWDYGPTLTAPGEFRDHHYPNIYAGNDSREALGTLWYHDHTEDFTAPNVYRGMVGAHLMFDELDSGDENDPNPSALHLPSGDYDVPLLIADFQFDRNGVIQFNTFENDGMLGNKFTVNGVVQPYFQVAQRKYRFRLLDAGPSRFYEFYLVHNNTDQQFTYIANDGNLLPAPIRNMTKIRMGVAERADIVIDFSQYPIGSQLFLVNRLEQTKGRGPSGRILTPGTRILRFDVRRPSPGDPSQVPDRLRPLPPINESEAVRRRSFRLQRENGFWVINDKVFDAERPLVTVKKGTAEIWTLNNESGSWSHPMHIHFEEGRILGRGLGGRTPPPLHEQGRKDVYALPPLESMRVFLRFRDFVGKYVMHCHNTVHEDGGMMFRWDIVP